MAWTPLEWLTAAAERPPEGVRTLYTETVVPTSLTDTFAFFSDAANLERMTPPWLKFEIRTPLPIVMAEGTLIDYRIGLYGLPIPWRTRIDVWEPGVCFVDRQLLGPYLWWRHEHHFLPAHTGTRVIDKVDYVPRAAWLSSPLVARDVERIFEFRRLALTRLLTAG